MESNIKAIEGRSSAPCSRSFCRPGMMLELCERAASILMGDSDESSDDWITDYEAMKTTPTLNERLAAAGYTTEPSEMQYSKKILFMGSVIFEGTSHDVTAWLDGKPDSSWEFEDFDSEDDFAEESTTNETECEECEGTGQRAFAVNCPELTPCVDCGGTGRVFSENANVDLPDTAAQDSDSKSNNPAVSG